MRLPIVQFGDPILRKRCEPIKEFDTKYLHTLIADIIQTIVEDPAAALAAPQVGQAVQLTVIDVGEPDKHFPYSFQIDGKTGPYSLFFPLVMVNPKITYASPEKDSYAEGCMSIGELRVNVLRSTDIVVDYQDALGNKHTIEANGILARCIQHELDHLEGILMIDRTSPQELNRVKSRLKKIKRETRDFIKSQKSM